MPIRRLFVLLLACGLAFAACGGDDDDGEASGGDDQARADEAIAGFEEQLRADGFEPEDDDDDDDGGASDLEFESEECQDFAEAFPQEGDELPGETATAESDSFVQGEIDQGGSEVTVEGSIAFVDDEAAFDMVFDIFEDDRFGSCVEEALLAAFEEGMQTQEVPIEISEFDVESFDDDIGDRSTGLRMTGAFSAIGIEFPLEFAFNLAQQERASAFVTTVTIGESSDAADITELTESLLDAVS